MGKKRKVAIGILALLVLLGVGLFACCGGCSRSQKVHITNPQELVTNPMVEDARKIIYEARKAVEDARKAIQLLQQQLDDEKKAGELLRQQLAEARIAPPRTKIIPTPDPVMQIISRTPGEGRQSVILHYYAGRAAEIHEVNEGRGIDTHVDLSTETSRRPTVEIQADIRNLQNKIWSAETALDLARAESIMGNNDPRISTPRRANIRQKERDLWDMKSQLDSLKEELQGVSRP